MNTSLETPGQWQERLASYGSTDMQRRDLLREATTKYEISFVSSHSHGQNQY